MYRYDIRYMIGPDHWADETVVAETWEGDDAKISFIIKGLAVFVIRTCHVVYVREVGEADTAETGS